MITETNYICEICKNRYENSYSAIKCEARGIADPNDLPVGFMYPYYHHDFVGIFAIAKSEINFYDKHYISISSYAARTQKYPMGVCGTDLGHMCGGGSDGYLIPSNFMSNRLMSKEHIESPEFERMVFALKANNIIPQYINQKREIIFP